VDNLNIPITATGTLEDQRMFAALVEGEVPNAISLWVVRGRILETYTFSEEGIAELVRSYDCSTGNSPAVRVGDKDGGTFLVVTSNQLNLINNKVQMLILPSGGGCMDISKALNPPNGPALAFNQSGVVAILGDNALHIIRRENEFGVSLDQAHATAIFTQEPPVEINVRNRYVLKTSITVNHNVISLFMYDIEKRGFNVVYLFREVMDNLREANLRCGV